MATKKTRKKTPEIQTSADKVHNVFFRTYVDPTKALLSLGGISHYAYICHDRDVAENGKVKASHFHCVVTFTNPRYPSAVEKAIRETIPEEQRNGNELHFEVCKGHEGRKKAIRYLVHQDNPDKAPYELHEVKTDSQDYLQSAFPIEETKDPNEVIDTNLEFMVNLVDKNPFQMGLIYGRDYMKNNARYEDFKRVLEYSYINSDHMTLEAKLIKKETLDDDEGKRLDLYRAEVISCGLQKSLIDLHYMAEANFKGKESVVQPIQERIDLVAKQVDNLLNKISHLRKD